MLDYENLYRTQDPFGTKPHPLAKSILRYKTSGTVLDLGAGQGRNTLFLAQNGFQVSAVDSSEEGIKKIAQSSKELRIPVVSSVADISRFDFSAGFDVVLLMFILHYLKKEDALSIIQKARMHTAAGGLNVVAVVTSDGDFYRKKPNTTHFYPEPGELKKMYRDWNILFSEEKETKSFEKKTNGDPMSNTVSFLIAQKEEK